MATFRSLKTAPGAFVVQTDKSLIVVNTDPILRNCAKNIAEHTRSLMMNGPHLVQAVCDLGFLLGYELIETMYALDSAAGDIPKIARLTDEANRFAISLQVYEQHPFVYIYHDRVGKMTRVTPMLDINTLEGFQAWRVGCNTRDRELMGFEPLLADTP